MILGDKLDKHFYKALHLTLRSQRRNHNLSSISLLCLCQLLLTISMSTVLALACIFHPW